MSAEEGLAEIPEEVMRAAREHVGLEIRALQDRVRQQRKELRALGRANQRIWDKLRLANVETDRFRQMWLKDGRMISRIAHEVQSLKGWDMTQLFNWMAGLKP